MTETVHFTSSAQLYENKYGELAIRFDNNEVFEKVGFQSKKDFVTEALAYLESRELPAQWQEMPFRKLDHDGRSWHLVSSFGFLDGDQSRPAVGLDVKPEELGESAKRYLDPVMSRIIANA